MKRNLMGITFLFFTGSVQAALPGIPAIKQDGTIYHVVRRNSAFHAIRNDSVRSYKTAQTTDINPRPF